MPLWFTRLAAAFTVIVGPALLIYAAADIGPGSGWIGRNGWPWPSGFQAAAAFGYTLAIGLLGAQYGVLRTLTAAIGCIVLPFATGVLGSVLLFGVTPSSWASAAWVSLFALPTALFQVLVLRNRYSVRFLEILAHVIATGGVMIIMSLFYQRSSQGLFSAWPALLTALPFVALATWRLGPQVPWRFGLSCLLALLPVYTVKTAIDARSEPIAWAATWPVRLYSEYISPAERDAIIKQVTAIRPSVPVRIGEHWYRFERIGFRASVRANNIWRPDRILSVQLDIPVADIDLREIAFRDHVQLNIIAVTDGRPAQTTEWIEKFGTQVAIRDRDLLISVVVPRKSNIDREAVRDKIRRFIENSRVNGRAG